MGFVRQQLLRYTKKFTGLPDRRKVVSLLAAQDFEPGLQSHALEKNLLLDGCLQHIDRSRLINASFIAPQWVCHPVYLYRFKDVYVSVGTGNIYFPKAGKYVFETSWGWGKYRTASIGSFKQEQAHALESSKPVYVFSGRGYHGVMEDLSSVLLLRSRGYDFEIVIDPANRWMKSLLELFLPEDAQPVFVENGAWVTAREFLVTTKSAFGEFVHPELISTLNDAAKALPGSPNERKLFILRSDSLKRSYADEPAVANFFADRGFELVSLGEMSVGEQVSAFRNASMVAGLHGAGFVNLVWARRQVEVTELFFDTHFNSCYSSLCHVLEHKYRNFQLDENRAFSDQKDQLNSSVIDFT